MMNFHGSLVVVLMVVMVFGLAAAASAQRTVAAPTDVAAPVRDFGEPSLREKLFWATALPHQAQGGWGGHICAHLCFCKTETGIYCPR